MRTGSSRAGRGRSACLALLLGATALHAQYSISTLPSPDSDANDLFGMDVDVRGGRVIVGASGASYDQSFPFGDIPAAGTVYIYSKVGGAWSLESQLWPSDLEALAGYGHGVGIDGDRAVAGAPFKDESPFPGTGILYVLQLTRGVWMQEAKLKVAPVPEGAQFGYSAAIEGTTVVGGAPFFNEPPGVMGALWVFRLVPGQGWKQLAHLVNASKTHAQRLGMSVALSGDTILGGAPGWGCVGPPNTCTGAAFVFREVGGTWQEEATLAPADGEYQDQFGFGVDIEGDVAVVGSQLDDDLGSDSGSTYVFRRTGTTWAQEAKLLPCDGAPGANFGRSVAVSGDTIIVGAALDPEGAGGGAAYVFRREDGAWEEVGKIVLPGTAGAQAGAAAGIDGAVAAIGAPSDDAAAHDAGRGWVAEDVSVHPTWSSLSGGLAGQAGVATLSGTGTLAGATPVTLSLAGAAPLALSTLVVGLDMLCVPFKGGLLVPAPDVLIGGLVTDAGGAWSLGGTWPPGVPSGFDVLLQAWTSDAAGPHGLAASGALEAHAP